MIQPFQVSGELLTGIFFPHQNLPRINETIIVSFLNFTEAVIRTTLVAESSAFVNI